MYSPGQPVSGGYYTLPGTQVALLPDEGGVETDEGFRFTTRQNVQTVTYVQPQLTSATKGPARTCRALIWERHRKSGRHSKLCCADIGTFSRATKRGKRRDMQTRPTQDKDNTQRDARLPTLPVCSTDAVGRNEVTHRTPADTSNHYLIVSGVV